MTEQEQSISGNWSSRNKALLILFWAYVGVPFLWGLYETLTEVANLFTG